MEIRIYIANLGKYNEGELVGKWLELPVSEQELQDAYIEIGVGYRDEEGNYHHGLWVDDVCYEEVAIHDYEAPEGVKIDEYDDIERLNYLAKVLSFLSEGEEEEVELLLKTGEFELEDAIDSVMQLNGAKEYRIWRSCCNMGDVAYTLYEETGMLNDIPENLLHYIDWDKVGHDMDEGNFYQVGYNTYVEIID